MNAYQPNTDDMQFVLSRVLNAPLQLQAMPVFAEVDALFAALDLDGSGQIEISEMNEALSRSGKGHF
jgi:Ca2+-binding EF-hand superfamily protein